MKSRALAAVEKTGVTQEVLREQWDAQAIAQTQPAPRKCLIIYANHYRSHIHNQASQS